MKTILAIYSSVSGDNSVSNQLAKNWVQQQDAHVIERDLATDTVPHLDGATVGAFFTPADQLTAEQSQQIALSNTLVEELKSADTLVISAPMYNFNVPSALKAWFDQVARVGVTFRYGATGPEGLLTGKKAIVVTSRGGIYKDSGNDFQVPYIKQFLGFIGIKDVEVVYAEGVSGGPEAKDVAVNDAEQSLQVLSA